MLPARSRSAPAVQALVFAACGALTAVASCADDGVDDRPTSDASVDEAGLDRAQCPEAGPAAESACALPEGTTCAFGACATIVICRAGFWRYASNPPPQLPCPEDPPGDTPCPACWPKGATCPYGSRDCSAPDASVNTTIASCVDGKWSVEVKPCRDAGPDVQGDAGEDAD